MAVLCYALEPFPKCDTRGQGGLRWRQAGTQAGTPDALCLFTSVDPSPAEPLPWAH